MDPSAPSDEQRNDLRHFLDWCAFYGLPMPAGGDEVAEYPLDMMVDGAPLADIQRAASSIAACYEQRRCFLDPAPIRAALKIAAAQLSPGRTLN
jgi:hypothetical protein